MIEKYRMGTLFLSIKISIAIAILNAVMEEIIVFFVKSLGIDTYSQTTNLTKYVVFVSYFFNGTIVILFMASRFQGSMFNGKYSDFSMEWYIVIGSQFIMNSIIECFMPCIGHWIERLYERFFRARDQKKCFCCCLEKFPKKTKCRTKYEYFEYYAGPEYLIHSRYAIMSNVAWYCFMLGPGIPILFPLGLLQLCSLYLIEKYALAYFYRAPINYNHYMNEEQVKMLLVAPILYSAFGFWFLSNR